MDSRMEQIAHCYLDAKEYVIGQGYDWEIDWQAGCSFKSLTERNFLGETAWVILSSGFRESVVRKIYPQISEAFLGWINSELILAQIKECRKKALLVFGNKKKIDAICKVIARVAKQGFLDIKRKVKKYGLAFVQELPFIGPVTGLHLLKNIGIPIAKPDRHLVRLANATGFETAQDLCEALEVMVGDGIAEIDLVLWRYAAIKPNYLASFT